MTTPLSPETAKTINAMRDEQFARTFDILNRLGTLAEDAKRHLTDSIPAQDIHNEARSVTMLTSYIRDELAARFTPHYGLFDTMLDSEHLGMQAVGTASILKMLGDAPDLLQLAVERLTDEYRYRVFEGGQYTTDRTIKIWRR